MEFIGAAKFKEQCLAILDALPPEGVIITKRGRPIAKLVAVPHSPAELIGSLRDKVVIHGDILSTGLDWNADAES